MNSAGNLRRTSSAFGLKRVSLRGRAQLKAHLSKKKQASAAERTFADAKSEKTQHFIRERSDSIGSAGRCGGLRDYLSTTLPSRICPLLAHAKRPRRSPRSNPGRVMQLFRKIHTFRGESAFSTWLHRLAVNLVLMRLRRKSPPMISIDATADLDDETSSSTIDISAPDLLLEGSIDRVALDRSIEQLPAGCRAIFVLHDIQGYQHGEIATIVGRSAGNSKSQLHKARKRLRELLHEAQREKARDTRLAARKLDSRSRAKLFPVTAETLDSE